jgi:pilus assembly protein CpaF
MSTLSQRLDPTGASGSVSFPSVTSLSSYFSTQDQTEEVIRIKSEVNKQLINSLGAQVYEGSIDTGVLEKKTFEAISRAILASDITLSAFQRAALLQEIIDEILGLGPLQPLLRDETVSEIMVNRFDQIYIEKSGILQLSEYSFTSEDHLRRTIERIVSKIGRRIDESSPLVDARLMDGSRVNAAIPPIALDGSTVVIRKFAKEPFRSRDLILTGTCTSEAMEFLGNCVLGRLNILISGGTGSGKTTTLNVLSSFIPLNERIITIEDAAELQLSQPHVVRLESRPSNVEGKGAVSIRELVKNTLRMRPDRIVVGEVRDAAALDMLQAMNTGHDGSLTTVHSNSSKEAIYRLETLVLMAGMDLPVAVIRQQIGTAIDLIIQQSRLRNGKRHITQISEVEGVKDGEIVIRDIFKFEYGIAGEGDQSLGKLIPTGNLPTFLKKLEDRGVVMDPKVFLHEE